ncbi:MAG: peptidoglycan-binding protein [Candidatus Gracilibacteria bacterium]|nr:peptidoglycan-binding protein [Candidatus Gracilibacteria bacterium]
MNFYKHFLNQFLFLFGFRFQDNLGNFIESLTNVENEINVDGILTPKEKESFSRYLKEVVFADEKVEIHELTRGKLRDFISREWGDNIESSLLWKGGIETLQEKLGVKSDGEFGPATLKALLDFQAKNNIVKDGLVGDETIDALNLNLKGGKITNGIKKNKENKEIGNTPEEVLAVFNKTRKGKIFLDYVSKYSEISIEELAGTILRSSKAFDIPQNRIVSVLVGEADISDKSNPFKANLENNNRAAKGVGQFLPDTFKDLYSKTIWKKGVAVEGNILQYFEAKGEKKYAESLKNIGINNQNDRYDPEKSIMAIGAYLRYIMMVGKGVNGDPSMAVARYNLGPNGIRRDHLKHNPAVAKFYRTEHGDKEPTEGEVALAAKKYYSQYA